MGVGERVASSETATVSPGGLRDATGSHDWPVRRAAEWSPSFAEDGLYLQAAVALLRPRAKPLEDPAQLATRVAHAELLPALPTEAASEFFLARLTLQVCQG